MAIRAIAFDAYGTLYDVQSVRGLAVELCGDKGELVTHLWRLKQLEYTWLRGLMDAYEDFWSVTGAALAFSLEAAGLTPTPALCQRLMAAYLELALYPEARTALDGLAGFKLGILSNGSQKMLDALVQSSAIAPRLDAVISVDKAKTYKPNPRCYALAGPALGVSTEEILFVSANGFDIAGAKNAGLRVVRIARTADPGCAVNSTMDAATLYRLLRGRDEMLGAKADFQIAALTDLRHVVSLANAAPPTRNLER